jgi:hypothetical protein
LFRHPGFPVTRNKAGIFELADLGEPPYDLIRLLGSKPPSVGIVVLHVRIFLHGLGVLEIFRHSPEDELVVELTVVPQHELDLLVLLISILFGKNSIVPSASVIVT